MNSISSPELTLRPATLQDLPEILTLLRETIEAICSRHYSREQIRVWTASALETKRWESRIAEQYFLVAEKGNKVVGFASLGKAGYLDVMYVHKNHLRKGVAEALFRELEREALRQGQFVLYSDVSITALPFFRKMGFQTVRENRKMMEGVEIINYRMQKQIN